MALTISQTSRLRQELQSKYAETLRDIELRLQDSDQSASLMQFSRDLADFATADLVSELGHALMDREVEDLRGVESALQRLTGGAIDVCSDCGEEINFERLLAYPTAERCIDCQRRHDHLYTAPNTPSL